MGTGFYQLLLVIALSLSLSSAVYLENNGYKNVVISFSSSTNSREIDFSKLKSVFSRASQYLFEATRRRAYFSEIVVALPRSWDETLCEELSSLAGNPDPRNFTVYIQESSPARVQHSKKCGERGEVIFLPVSWFSASEDNTDDNAREFVKLWATYQYGVFEEAPQSEGSCFTPDGQSWSPTGCYNVYINSSFTIDSKGLSQCDFGADSHLLSEMKSSIMFSTKLPNITEFCDGSATRPHSPVAQTHHNRLCNRKSVWHVIKNNEDFKYGRNTPITNKDFIPSVTFKCFQEKKPNLLFIVQNASVGDISQIVKEVRQSLVRFLLYNVPKDTKVSLVTFSDELTTAASTAISLNLMDPEDLKSSLKWNLRAIRDVTSVCVTCGLKKAADVLGADGYNSVVVFLVLASAVENMNSEAFRGQLENVTQKLNLMVIEDQMRLSIPQGVIDGLHRNGGRAFFLPSELVTLNMQLNVILSDLFKSPLHFENELIVVHQATFVNVTFNISDTFAVDDDVQGELLYTFKCNNADMLDFKTSGCHDLVDVKDAGYLCGMVSTLKPTNDSKRLWNFRYPYLGGSQRLTCTSIATVRLSANQNSLFTVNGWLSDYEVRPGDDALIIYAEILKNYENVPGVRVEAHIARPRADTPFTLTLRDNGNGDPDVKKGDGIYSRYFSSFTTKGIYTVTVKVQIEDPDNRENQVDKRLVNRVDPVGTFIVTGDPPAFDIYPPNRITDLTVVEVDHENSTVTLQWTAPGDDYDMGQVAAYEVFYSNLWEEVTDGILDETLVSLLRQDSSAESDPSASGGTETKKYGLPVLNVSSLYYIAVRGRDRVDNQGVISNLVQVFLYPLTSRPWTGNNTSESTTNVATQTEQFQEKIVYVKVLEGYQVYLISACCVLFLLFAAVSIALCVVCCRKGTTTSRRHRDIEVQLSSKERHNVGYVPDSGNNAQTANSLIHQESQLYKVISKKTSEDRVSADPTASNRNSQVEKDMGLV